MQAEEKGRPLNFVLFEGKVKKGRCFYAIVVGMREMTLARGALCGTSACALRCAFGTALIDVVRKMALWRCFSQR